MNFRCSNDQTHRRPMIMNFIKQHLLLSFLIFTLIGCAQESKQEVDIRLLPRYGWMKKSQEQIAADQDFLKLVFSDEKYKNNKRLASDDLINRGFDYLYQGDLKTAMYRFNQAYLVDSTNSNLYWGFGGVYMMQSQFEKAKEQYELGLKEDPANVFILTDLATYYMMKFDMGGDDGDQNLKEAIRLFEKSYSLNNTYQNTLYKLSNAYRMSGNCASAWRLYNECKALGGDPITAEYTEVLKRSCKEPG